VHQSKLSGNPLIMLLLNEGDVFFGLDVVLFQPGECTFSRMNIAEFSENLFPKLEVDLAQFCLRSSQLVLFFPLSIVAKAPVKNWYFHPKQKIEQVGVFSAKGGTAS